jgi:hemoglobin/transferrin/lactoferrin receptor protein
VNAITCGVENLRPESLWDRNLYYRCASGENANIARAESISRIKDNLGLSAGYSFKDFGNIQGGDEVGEQEKTGYDERNWDGKVEYFLPSDNYLVLAHQTLEMDDAWRTHATIYGIDWKGLSLGKDLRRTLFQDRDLTYLQYHQYSMDTFVDEIHTGISRHFQGESQDRLRTGNKWEKQGFDVNTLGSFLTLSSPSSLGHLIYGFEFYYDRVDSFKHTLNADGSVKSRSIQGPVADDADYTLSGLYIQDEISLSERFEVILGGRYEAISMDADKVNYPVGTPDTIKLSEDWTDFAVNARVLCHLNKVKPFNVFAGVSKGFRAPNLSDLTSLDDVRTDEIETPSPDLDPEDFISYELGFKAADPDFDVQLTCFYTDIEGMIVKSRTGNTLDDSYEVTKKNAGDGYVKGVEFDGRCRMWRGLSTFGTLTWMDGEVDTYPTSESALVREPISRLMPTTSRLGLKWQEDEQYWVEASCTLAETADRLSTSDKADTSRIPPGGTPGYAVWDIGTGWNCRDNLSLSLSLENLTDEDYRIHGSGVNEPGRNLVVAADWTF